MHVRLTPSHQDLFSDDDKIVGIPIPNSEHNPPNLDWREDGFVTPPCNQKSCGSCYAFSIAYSVTGQIFKRAGKLVMLSEQQIVDCSIITGNHGCTGGSLRNTLRYLETSGGLMRQQEYPYSARVGDILFII